MMRRFSEVIVGKQFQRKRNKGLFKSNIVYKESQ